MSTDELNKDLIGVIRESANKLGMSKKITRSPTHNRKPWCDTEVREAKRRLNHSLSLRKLSQFTSSDRILYLDCKRHYKNLLVAKRKIYINSLRDKLSNAGNSKKFWKAIRAFNFKLPFTNNPIQIED